MAKPLVSFLLKDIVNQCFPNTKQNKKVNMSKNNFSLKHHLQFILKVIYLSVASYYSLVQLNPSKNKISVESINNNPAKFCNALVNDLRFENDIGELQKST